MAMKENTNQLSNENAERIQAVDKKSIGAGVTPNVGEKKKETKPKVIKTPKPKKEPTPSQNELKEREPEKEILTEDKGTEDSPLSRNPIAQFIYDEEDIPPFLDNYLAGINDNELARIRNRYYENVSPLARLKDYQEFIDNLKSIYPDRSPANVKGVPELQDREEQYPGQHKYQEKIDENLEIAKGTLYREPDPNDPEDHGGIINQVDDGADYMLRSAMNGIRLLTGQEREQLESLDDKGFIARGMVMGGAALTALVAAPFLAKAGGVAATATAIQTLVYLGFNDKDLKETDTILFDVGRAIDSDMLKKLGMQNYVDIENAGLGKRILFLGMVAATDVVTFGGLGKIIKQGVKQGVKGTKKVIKGKVVKKGTIPEGTKNTLEEEIIPKGTVTHKNKSGKVETQETDVIDVPFDNQEIPHVIKKIPKKEAESIMSVSQEIGENIVSRNPPVSPKIMKVKSQMKESEFLIETRGKADKYKEQFSERAANASEEAISEASDSNSAKNLLDEITTGDLEGPEALAKIDRYNDLVAINRTNPENLKGTETVKESKRLGKARSPETDAAQTGSGIAPMLKNIRDLRARKLGAIDDGDFALASKLQEAINTTKKSASLEATKAGGNLQEFKNYHKFENAAQALHDEIELLHLERAKTTNKSRIKKIDKRINKINKNIDDIKKQFDFEGEWGNPWSITTMNALRGYQLSDGSFFNATVGTGLQYSADWLKGFTHKDTFLSSGYAIVNVPFRAMSYTFDRIMDGKEWKQAWDNLLHGPASHRIEVPRLSKDSAKAFKAVNMVSNVPTQLLTEVDDFYNFITKNFIGDQALLRTKQKMVADGMSEDAIKKVFKEYRDKGEAPVMYRQYFEDTQRLRHQANVMQLDQPFDTSMRAMEDNNKLTMQAAPISRLGFWIHDMAKGVRKSENPAVSTVGQAATMYSRNKANEFDLMGRYSFLGLIDKPSASWMRLRKNWAEQVVGNSAALAYYYQMYRDDPHPIDTFYSSRSSLSSSIKYSANGGVEGLKLGKMHVPKNALGAFGEVASISNRFNALVRRSWIQGKEDDVAAIVAGGAEFMGGILQDTWVQGNFLITLSAMQAVREGRWDSKAATKFKALLPGMKLNERLTSTIKGFKVEPGTGLEHIVSDEPIFRHNNIYGQPIGSAPSLVISETAEASNVMFDTIARLDVLLAPGRKRNVTDAGTRMTRLLLTTGSYDNGDIFIPHGESHIRIRRSDLNSQEQGFFSTTLKLPSETVNTEFSQGIKADFPDYNQSLYFMNLNPEDNKMVLEHWDNQVDDIDTGAGELAELNKRYSMSSGVEKIKLGNRIKKLKPAVAAAKKHIAMVQRTYSTYLNDKEGGYGTKRFRHAFRGLVPSKVINNTKNGMFHFNVAVSEVKSIEDARSKGLHRLVKRFKRNKILLTNWLDKDSTIPKTLGKKEMENYIFRKTKAQVIVEMFNTHLMFQKSPGFHARLISMSPSVTQQVIDRILRRGRIGEEE